MIKFAENKEDMFKKLSLTILFSVFGWLASNALDLRNPEIVSPGAMAKIDSLLSDLRQQDGRLGDRIVAAAKKFIGSPEDDYYGKDSLGNLKINLNSFTPLMLVNNSIALARAASIPGIVDWRTFAAELERVACRRGEDKGFPFIMYHGADWIGDNSARGVVKELTENYNGVEVRTKSLDDMTRNRDKFAALKDSATFENVRMVEMGFRTHRIPTLKRETIKRKDLMDDLQNGDVIILVPYKDGHDIFDIGIIEMKEDGPHMIHVSPQSHKVVEEEEVLPRYMGLLTKYYQGYRIIRPTE